MVCKHWNLPIMRHAVEFQSLLCWIMVCKNQNTQPTYLKCRFNPCYVGLWSVSKNEKLIAEDSLVFQSLLCWIMVCKRARAAIAAPAIKFQSLLCWIMVCKAVVLSSVSPPNTSFNPCYVGLWSVSRSIRHSRFMSGSTCFNPCYVGLWSVRPESSPIIAKPKFSFNPCYVGLWSVSAVVPPIVRLPSTFQSLLCWIMVCKTVGSATVCGMILPRFQSLLCWIMVCKPTALSYLNDQISFNPCYVGLWSVSSSADNPSSKTMPVSILVMLDYGL